MYDQPLTYILTGPGPDLTSKLKATLPAGGLHVMVTPLEIEFTDYKSWYNTGSLFIFFFLFGLYYYRGLNQLVCLASWMRSVCVWWDAIPVSVIGHFHNFGVLNISLMDRNQHGQTQPRSSSRPAKGHHGYRTSVKNGPDLWAISKKDPCHGRSPPQLPWP